MEEIVTIDRAGRLVVPKSFRTRLHLDEGTRLRLRDDDGRRLILEPIARDAVPVEAGGLLVIRGRLLGELPDHRELRARRIDSLSGRRRCKSRSTRR